MGEVTGSERLLQRCEGDLLRLERENERLRAALRSDSPVTCPSCGTALEADCERQNKAAEHE